VFSFFLLVGPGICLLLVGIFSINSIQKRGQKNT
jgi:hypothetical protein